MAIAVEYDLREEIRACLRDGQTDPHKIASETAQTIPEDALRELVPALIANVVREVIRSERNRSVRTEEQPLSPRWEAVRAVRSRLDCVWAIGTEWKQLRDCTRDDIQHLVNDYEIRVEANAAWRDAFARIEREMRQRRVKTVGSLPAGLVDEVLP